MQRGLAAETREDFSPQTTAQHAPVVVNVQAAHAQQPQTFLHCRYCGTLNPSQNVGARMRCTSCGAAL